MIFTHNLQTPEEDTATEEFASSPLSDFYPPYNSNTLNFPVTQHLHNETITHHPQAGLNPIVDAAGYLLSIMGEMKTAEHFLHLATLQKELIQEINAFQNAVKPSHYNTEYILVCRYVICATIDELISSTSWGGQRKWEQYSLLAAFNQDTRHQEKFFSIMDRAVKEPAYYIDLMELMYICLSMGYCGHFQGSDHNQAQLDQITSSLYKYIRTHRGNFSKTLSPLPIRTPKPVAPHASTSVLTIILITACIIMTLFITLGYLMEMISNEATSNFTDIQKTVIRNHH